MRLALLAVALLSISAIPAFAAPDFSIACDKSGPVIIGQAKNIADCEATSIDGFEGRLVIDCEGLPAKADCYSQWQPYLSPEAPIQQFTLYVQTSGNVNPDMGDFNVTASNLDGTIVRKAEMFSYTFVIPESPIGVIAMVVSSLAVLGVFIARRRML